MDEDLSQNLLNYISDIENAIKNPTANTLICPYCQCEKLQSNFYRLSGKCPAFGHKFCLDCIVSELTFSIQSNEDLFCLIDECPNRMEEKCHFFTKIPTDLHNDYFLWKNSDKYKSRNQLRRETLNKRNSLNSSKESFLSSGVEELIEEGSKRNQGGHVKNGVNSFEDDTDVSQISRHIIGIKQERKRKRKGEIIKGEEEEIMPVIPRRVDEQILEPRRQNQHYQIRILQRDYTFCRFINKLIILTFGLPLLVFFFLVFFIVSSAIYLLYFISVLLTILAPFCIAYIFVNYHRFEGVTENTGVLFFCCLFTFVFCLGLVFFFKSSLYVIEKLVIGNLWMLLKRTCYRICYYPSIVA